MKKVLFTLLLLTNIISAYAQETGIDSIGRGFRGVFTAQDDNIVFTYFIKEKAGKKDEAELNVHLFNHKLVALDTIKIPVGKNTQVVAANFSMSTFLFILADPEKRTMTTIGYEQRNGIVKNTVQSKLSEEYFSPDYKAFINQAMPDGFTIVTSLPGKNRGYKVEAVDRELNPRWSKTFVPEKGNWDIQQCMRSMERLVLLVKETSGSKFVFNLVTLQADQGEVMFTKELKQGNDYFYPNTINAFLDVTSISGSYYKNGTITDIPAGIFFTQLDAASEPRREVKMSMDKLTQELDPKIAVNLQNGNYKIFAHEFARKSGGYLGVMELYSITPSPDAKTIKTMELILISVKDNTNPENIDTTIVVDIIEKQPIEAIIKNSSTLNDIALTQWAYSKGVFGVRNYYTRGADGRVLFKTQDTMDMKAYFLPIMETVEKAPHMSPIHRVPDARRTKGKLEQKFYLDAANPYELNKFQYKDVRVMFNGSVIYYEYEPPFLMMWFDNML
jgi:hypothetical protein